MVRFVALLTLCSAATFTATGGYTLLPAGVSQRLKENFDPSCDIKGNISVETGERIFHIPGQEYYDMTRIDPLNGERWFCSEADARAAGWRKSKV